MRNFPDLSANARNLGTKANVRNFSTLQIHTTHPCTVGKLVYSWLYWLPSPQAHSGSGVHSSNGVYSSSGVHTRQQHASSDSSCRRACGSGHADFSAVDGWRRPLAAARTECPDGHGHGSDEDPRRGTRGFRMAPRHRLQSVFSRLSEIPCLLTRVITTQKGACVTSHTRGGRPSVSQAPWEGRP